MSSHTEVVSCYIEQIIRWVSKGSSKELDDLSKESSKILDDLSKEVSKY